jgi:DNA-directed RNA polymerase subunit M/transcription elongation factor TFIIS
VPTTDADLHTWWESVSLPAVPGPAFACINEDDPLSLHYEPPFQPHEFTLDEHTLPPWILENLVNVDVHLSNALLEGSEALHQQSHSQQASYEDLAPPELSTQVELCTSPLLLPPCKDRPLSPPLSYQLDPAPRRFQCPDCNRRFLERRQLSNHKRNEHKYFPCTDCGKKYRHNKSLWQHRREVHEKILLGCGQCGYTTGRMWNLQRHQDNKHPSGGDLKDDQEG